MAGLSLLENTLYINLEERTDRLIHVISELKKIGITGERFNAKRTQKGAVGCTLSHIACLELAKKRNYSQVFICEDDITFTKPEVFLDSLEKFSQTAEFSNFDVLIIGGNNAPPYKKLSECHIKISNCQTTTGYVVKSHYYDKLISNFRESVTNLLKYPEHTNKYALDIYWKRLQQSDNWYMIIPATVTQCAGYSDIEEHDVDYNFLMTDIEKKWLQNTAEYIRPPPNRRQPAPQFRNMFYVNKAST